MEAYDYVIPMQIYQGCQLCFNFDSYHSKLQASLFISAYRPTHRRTSKQAVGHLQRRSRYYTETVTFSFHLGTD